ncbi:acetylornithine deacetylase [Idiomarina tyrosinivorans]|uniref:Acetylornithine deacetylase n=1 Tax=Idiomarina tyrosinivorans TaxID=1445662 RepID=A0A432ZLW0_9GAMM|nr:acetylornithine deacetylase [Idiomarina tyrosinivorans]RUO78920.1 acetylornithine deacetylase [Idiomarina tyrosinivorans]
MSANLPSFFQLYQRLISIPSVSCLDPSWDTSNKPVIDQLAEWLESLGFSVEVKALLTSPGKYNLLARYQPHNERQGGLLLSGHTDTVPWDEGRWQFDPFKLTEKDNRWYGLGSADMKGFFAFVIEALKSVDINALKKPLTILATADEETTMAGARELNAFTAFKPDFAVIGEPTSMAPIKMHKGHLTNAVKVIGKSGHSSNPAAGVNAIDIIHEVIGELKTLRQHLQQRYQQPSFEVPYPTMNFGHIHGGDAANRICACCELHIDLRPLPGMDLAEFSGLIQQQLGGIQQRYPGAIEIIDMHPPIPGFACPDQSPWLQLAEALSGETAAAVNYCTEAPFVQQLGCDTIVMGPGSIAQAHQPNEFITLAEIDPAQQQIRELIRRVCE